MRPRKLKPVSRNRPGTAGSLVQRTILPKNSEYITIIPMMPGTQIPNHPPEKSEATETIVGHPINGIQRPINAMPSSPNVTVTVRNPVILGNILLDEGMSIVTFSVISYLVPEFINL